MSEALVSQLARALNLPPDAARHTLDHLVATLREQLDASGHATVPGLGTFVRNESSLSFQPDEALARAVNHRYAGLRPITAGSPDDEAEPEPQPADPFADVDPESATVGFQPLDAIVETEEPEKPEQPEAAVEMGIPEMGEESEPDPIDPFEETEPTTELSTDELLDENEVEEDAIDEPERDDEPVLDAEPFEDESEMEASEAETAVADADADDVPDDELDSYEVAATSEFLEVVEHDASPADPWAMAETYDDETEGDEAAFEEDSEAHAPPPDAEPENEDLDVLDLEPETTSDLDEDDDEVTDDAVEPETEELAALLADEPDATEAVDEIASDEEVEDGVLGSLNDLARPDEDDSKLDADHDEDEISAILPVMAGGDTTASDDRPDAAGATKTPVAPAVAATARNAAAAEPAPQRRSRAMPILIGVVAVLGIVALLWFLNRETDTPIAGEPAPADTTAIAAGPPTDTQTPADTSTAAVDAPPEPVASTDPLRSGDGIDQAAGGFSWVVGSELSREPAERRVSEFRSQGLRAGVIAEEAAGRTRYRVALGQFESIEQAERFRSDLPAGVPADTWLLRL